MKIRALFGLSIVIVFMLSMVCTVSAAIPAARGKPGGGGSTGGVGSAGPASKAGADGIVKKYALCVGVSNYKDPSIGDLSYCDEDASDWANYFQSKGYTVKTLIDSQASEVSVENALFAIIAGADADDIVHSQPVVTEPLLAANKYYSTMMYTVPTPMVMVLLLVLFLMLN
jgi:hypothetical protein